MNEISNFGWARIENKISSCFSENYLLLEFSFDDSEKVSLKIVKGETEKEISMEKSRAEDFLKNIIYLGRKTEVRSQTAWTTIRYAKVEWRNLTFAEEKSGVINTFSNEWTIVEMKEYLPKIKDAKIAEKVKKESENGLHRRAIEIHLETEKFVERFFPATAKS